MEGVQRIIYGVFIMKLFSVYQTTNLEPHFQAIDFKDVKLRYLLLRVEAAATTPDGKHIVLNRYYRASVRSTNLAATAGFRI